MIGLYGSNLRTLRFSTINGSNITVTVDLESDDVMRVTMVRYSATTIMELKSSEQTSNWLDCREMPSDVKNRPSRLTGHAAGRKHVWTMYDAVFYHSEKCSATAIFFLRETVKRDTLSGLLLWLIAFMFFCFVFDMWMARGWGTTAWGWLN